MAVKKYFNKIQKKKAVQAQVQAYHKRATHTISVRFMKERDKEIIEWLDKQENKTDYLRQIIRKDIEEHKE